MPVVGMATVFTSLTAELYTVAMEAVGSIVWVRKVCVQSLPCVGRMGARSVTDWIVHI